MFSRESLIVLKKSKNGETEQNIIPMLRSLEVTQPDANTLSIHARVCCQNPSLNPMQLCAAVESRLPEFAPDFAKVSRNEIYDHQEQIFR